MCSCLILSWNIFQRIKSPVQRVCASTEKRVRGSCQVISPSGPVPFSCGISMVMTGQRDFGPWGDRPSYSGKIRLLQQQKRAKPRDYRWIWETHDEWYVIEGIKLLLRLYNFCFPSLVIEHKKSGHTFLGDLLRVTLFGFLCAFHRKDRNIGPKGQVVSCSRRPLLPHLPWHIQHVPKSIACNVQKTGKKYLVSETLNIFSQTQVKVGRVSLSWLTKREVK